MSTQEFTWSTLAAATADSGSPYFSPVLAAVIAVLGLGAAYVTQLVLAQRDDRLARIDRQLSEFYGPLLALAVTSNRSWSYFRSRYRPGIPYWDQDPPPTPEEESEWRTWMTTVFMPTHQAIRDIVTTKADLMVDQEVPECLLRVCEQVAAYEVILKKWDHQDFRENKTDLQFPGEDLEGYARDQYAALKARQSELLRHKT